MKIQLCLLKKMNLVQPLQYLRIKECSLVSCKGGVMKKVNLLIVVLALMGLAVPSFAMDVKKYTVVENEGAKCGPQNITGEKVEGVTAGDVVSEDSKSSDTINEGTIQNDKKAE